MNAPNQQQQQQNNPSTSTSTAKAKAAILPPDGWYLRPNLTSDDMVKLIKMQKFCEEAVARVGAMRNAVTVFQQNQVVLAQFQPSPNRNVAVNCAIQEMMNATAMHWHYVTLVYAEFVRLGFSPPPGKPANPSSSPTPATSGTTTAAIADV